MPKSTRCRAKNPDTCKVHGAGTAQAVPVVDLLQELGARRARSSAVRAEGRRGRQQMLDDLRNSINAGEITLIDGRTYVGRPLPLAAANVDRLTYEVERAARYGVEVVGVSDPREAVDVAWDDLVNSYDVSFKDEAIVIRDNESTLRNALLERVHAAAY